MNTMGKGGLGPIRLVFELARADNPRLYDELMMFQKGARRVNRLRVLAYDGLLAQYGTFSAGGGLPPVGQPVRSDLARAGDLTNVVFGPGLAE